MALVGLVQASDLLTAGRPLFVNPEEVCAVTAAPDKVVEGETVPTCIVMLCTGVVRFHVMGNVRDVAQKIGRA